MGDWDFSGGSAGSFDEPASPSKKPLTTGGLHIGLTLACLIAVTLVSFGVAFLMKARCLL